MKQQEAGKLLASYFDSWYSALVRHAFRATGDADIAEDLVQEVYLRLYDQLRRGKTIEKPEAWMFCVLSHEIGKWWRLKKKNNTLHKALENLDPAGAGQKESTVLQRTVPDLDAIAPLLQVLTAREQEVMLLRMASLKYREIGAKLGISANSVNTLLARAIRKLHRAAKRQKSWDVSSEVDSLIPTALQ